MGNAKIRNELLIPVVARFFEIAVLRDLNDDGKIDIVLRSAYYEGDEISAAAVSRNLVRQLAVKAVILITAVLERDVINVPDRGKRIILPRR